MFSLLPGATRRRFEPEAYRDDGDEQHECEGGDSETDARPVLDADRDRDPDDEPDDRDEGPHSKLSTKLRGGAHEGDSGTSPDIGRGPNESGFDRTRPGHLPLAVR